MIFKAYISILSLILLSTSALCQRNETGSRFDFIDRLENGENISIAALGTSLTGGTWKWFDVFQEWLDGVYPEQCTYINGGVGASASSYPVGKSGLDQVKLIAKREPDVVFIEFTVNDAYKPYNISVEDSRSNHLAMISELRKVNPDVEVILLTMNLVIDLPKQNLLESSKRSELPGYLKMYHEIAAQNNLMLIDNYPNWEKYYKNYGKEEYIKLVPDGIHPTDEGYKMILLPEIISRFAKPKWLPGEQRGESIAPEIDNFLRTLSGRLRFLLCKYEGSELISSEEFGMSGLSSDNCEWQLSIDAFHVQGDPDARDIKISGKLVRGSYSQAGLAVAFDFDDWDPGNYVLLPASVYNGNRHKIVDRGYAEGIDRKYLNQDNLPMMSVPIPHLSAAYGSISRLEVNSSNMATPAVCLFNKSKKHGFILLAEQKTFNNDNGFIVEESNDRNKASFIVSAPGVREKRPLFVGFTESEDRGINFSQGDEFNLNLRVYSFESQDIPSFFNKYMEVRKSLTGPNNPRNLVPFSQIADWMTERIDERWYEGDNYQFYCPENANWISFGWIGGLMNTFPMLALGDDRHMDRVTKTFDFSIPGAQGESGYFYGAINFDAECFSRDGYPEFPEIVLTRKNADVLYWMIKEFMLMKEQGKAENIKHSWEMNIKRLADAFVKTWIDYGQWGKSLDNKTGAVAEYNTTGGVMAIGGLALASDYFNNQEYLKIAKKAANYYYEEYFLKQGLTNGGCADILHNADSETAAAFMTSLFSLYEATGNGEWLEKSRNLANLCASWTTSYDYQLPPETELGKLGANLTGVYWASTQNKHGAPGICTNSGDALFKIYRATGDLKYADLLNDIIHAHGESIRPGGFTNERLTYCDAESRGERGTHVTGWNELNAFLISLEIPGIYLQNDSQEFYVFDHVLAEIINRSKDQITLKVTNPTKFLASVSLFIESENESKSPYGLMSFLDWPHIDVQAGQSKTVRIGSQGKITIIQTN